uniref:Nidogen n=1 Tax=Toxocara canis TaxID=6265 RepID=A0A183UQD6_TOXCA
LRKNNVKSISAISCDRKKHAQLITQCRRQNKQCQIDRKTREPFCGCPMGYNLKLDARTEGATCELLQWSSSFFQTTLLRYYFRQEHSLVRVAQGTVLYFIFVGDDPCALCKHRCHKASKCMPATDDSVYGYSCTKCDPLLGYAGDGFVCSDVDECADDHLNECDVPNAECENREPIYDNDLKYVCTCKEGWQGDPKGGYKWRKCIDTNECLNKNACGAFTKCINTPGSYVCSCLPGFMKKPGDTRQVFYAAQSCIDIDECRTSAPCHEKAICRNLPGNYSCSDEKYWCKMCDNATTTCVLNERNDGFVMYRNSIPRAFMCGYNYSYKCKCLDGFQPSVNDKNRCEDIAECFDPELNDCDKTPGQASCIELPGSYKCQCNDGFEGDGKTCHPVDPCLRNNPCATVAGTMCFNNNSVAECICKKGFVRPIANRFNMSAPCFDENSAPVNNCTICDNRTSICKKVEGPFYECVCREGYKMNAAGRCTNIDECRSITENDCDPNARCLDREPALHRMRYQCVCKPGYKGSGVIGGCTDIDECIEVYNACPLPHQKCVNTIGSYQCGCEEGFRKPPGMDACVNINECDDGSAHCPLMSRCIDRVPGYTCEFVLIIFPYINECKEGIGGRGLPACDALHGTCTDTFGSFLCDCKKGFVKATDMKTCTDKDECKEGENKCNAQIETCVNTIGSYRCECKYGLIKQNNVCVDRDECVDGSNKCLKNSICVNTFASYRCVCESGFKAKPGTHPLRPSCERDNVCNKLPTVCLPGRCESTDQEPYFRCHCPTTAVTIGDTKCVIVELKIASDPNYCDVEFQCPKFADCVNNQCACRHGYRWQETKDFPVTIASLKNRPPCQEINPCAESEPCVEPLKCVHTGPDTYACQCQEGLEFVSGECIDINECELKVGAAVCPQNSKCVNLRGSYKCECVADIDECASGEATCSPNAICINRDGSYECVCKHGFMGDGETCFDIDECDPGEQLHNCDPNTQNCVNLEGSFNCTCKPGYELTPSGCSDINECLSPKNNDCDQKGGIVRMRCVNSPGSYSCICPSGYIQIQPNVCEDMNECLSRPSVCPETDADICRNLNGTFACECRSGYQKPKGCKDKTKCACENINECRTGIKKDGVVKRACGYGAKCTDIPGSFTCKCAPGYDGDPYGAGCKLLDACLARNPCNNNTEDCKAVGKESFCVCKIGFLKTATGECVKNPCLENKGGCGANATCRPTRVGEGIEAKCRCANEMQLDDNNNCIPVDHCKCKVKVARGTPCKSAIACTAEHMLCINYGGEFNCTCEPGYRLSSDGKQCQNINECLEGVDGMPENRACEETAECVDTIGSYSCICPRGQIEDNMHKCKIDTPQCSREENCKHDPNAYCAKVDDTHQYCQCLAGFEGDALPGGSLCKPVDFCERAKRSAGGDVCKENEKCVNDKQRYRCDCKPGFERITQGADCTDIDECSSGFAYCGVTFVCVNNIGSYSCECPAGYRLNMNATRCEDIDECQQGLHNCTPTWQRCVNLPGCYRCECNSPAFINTANGCVDNNECATNQFNCPEFSTCVNTIGSYKCACNRGFRPETNGNVVARCVDVNECEEQPDACPKSAICKNRIGTYECICQPPAIQHGLQDCVVNATCESVCNEHAYCLKSERPDGAVYNCTCDVGYTGDGVHSCEPIDECQLGIAKCNEHAECIDKTPLYECRCVEPYQGDGVNKCEPEDVCRTRNDCPSEAKCIALFPKQEHGKWVTCECPSGFEFNPIDRQCHDVNECKDNGGLGPCRNEPPGVQCVNSQGSFSCVCPKGFKLGADRITCEDVDECLDIGTYRCSKAGGKCKNTYGSYECQCPLGLRQTPNKQYCVDIDECKEGTDNCDKKTTTCENTIGSYRCKCQSKGFNLIPGMTNICEDVNECVTGAHNCDPSSQLCHNTVGSFICNCSNGYVEKGGVCVPLSDCDITFECGANAFCVKRPSRENPNQLVPQCVCQDGYYGRNPQKFCDPIPECEQDSQCPANARCIETQATDEFGRATFTCECENGYRKVGSQCEPINECEENLGICGYGAICIDMRNLYKCVCRPGKIDVGTGANNVTCKTPSCADMTNPCHPDADCVDLPNGEGYTCVCHDGFRGIGTAELGCEPIDMCNEYTPCSQYASCVNEPRGSYTCTCKSGYTGNGTICHDIDECTLMGDAACDRNAKCINTQGSFTCVCNEGYEGEGLPGMCKDIDECSSPRLNKCDMLTTLCRNTEGSFECLCKKGFQKIGDNKCSCADINECLNVTHPVCVGHHCNNLPGDYRCDCKQGFQLESDGHKCVDINECTGSPCHANAECVNTDGSYTCTCKMGYEGCLISFNCFL